MVNLSTFSVAYKVILKSEFVVLQQRLNVYSILVDLLVLFIGIFIFCFQDFCKEMCFCEGIVGRPWLNGNSLF